jgi:hypothetical protein
MANNQDTLTFNWASSFNDIPSYVDHSNAIGRFKQRGANSYLWYYCDNSEERLRINSLTTIIDTCENIDWRFYNTEFANMGISPQRVYINDKTRGCEIFMNDGDTSNASSYGSCDITHGKSVTWSMANNAQYDF